MDSTLLIETYIYIKMYTVVLHFKIFVAVRTLQHCTQDLNVSYGKLVIVLQNDLNRYADRIQYIGRPIEIATTATGTIVEEKEFRPARLASGRRR